MAKFLKCYLYSAPKQPGITSLINPGLLVITLHPHFNHVYRVCYRSGHHVGDTR